VNVLVEIFSEQFAFDNLRKSLWQEYVDDGGAISLIEHESTLGSEEENNVYYFALPYPAETSTGGDTSLFWTSGNKIIAVHMINTTDKIPFGGYWGSLLNAYLIKYPSDLKFEERIYCSDSDNGRNYYTKGITTISNDNTTYSDACSGSQLTEKYCFLSNGKPTVGSVVYTCPNGCSYGACQGKAVPTCEDSDLESSPTAKGKVSGIDSTGTYYEQWDYCTGDGDKVVEMMCTVPGTGGKVPITKTLDCVHGCEDGTCLTLLVSGGGGGAGSE